MLARSTQNPAVTRFASAAVPGRRPGLRAYLLKPETGRTHQLRVAMKSLGAPILGDEVGRAERDAVLAACTTAAAGAQVAPGGFLLPHS
jgi:tRNA pseudouridine32 synthase/23S rRNA pseudouridine746 synthase